MATPSERLVERLADLRAVAPRVELVVMFGSVARGRSRPDSDLDVAVRCDGPADLDALYLQLAPRLATTLLDLVDLRRTGSLLGKAGA
jgi:predicted nucleotidyltransferase